MPRGRPKKTEDFEEEQDYVEEAEQEIQKSEQQPESVSFEEKQEPKVLPKQKEKIDDKEYLKFLKAEIERTEQRLNSKSFIEEIPNKLKTIETKLAEHEKAFVSIYNALKNLKSNVDNLINSK